jgi:hypothetical protein
MGMRIETEVILEDLSAGFDVLRAEAYVDEFRQIEQLRTDWDAGTIRFHRRRSSARVRLNGTLAGIGGLTVDPVVPNSSRVRALPRNRSHAGLRYSGDRSFDLVGIAARHRAQVSPLGAATACGSDYGRCAEQRQNKVHDCAVARRTAFIKLSDVLNDHFRDTSNASGLGKFVTVVVVSLAM